MPIKKANLFIALTALSFQVGVLYPWHHEISKHVEKLEEAVESLQTL
jgi:hypothetical protein